jgi:hypothetical protein
MAYENQNLIDRVGENPYFLSDFNLSLVMAIISAASHVRYDQAVSVTISPQWAPFPADRHAGFQGLLAVY